MCFTRRAGVVLPFSLAILLTVSCARPRPIARGTHPATQTLLTATKQELIQRVAAFYDSIQSFDAEVELAPSTGSVYRGTIKDYSTNLTAYVAYRKPEDIRIVALVPLVRTTLFSMASDGKTFRVYLPTENKFVEGANDAPAGSSKKFENARPQDFLAAMLVRPIGEHELTTRVDDITEQNAFYQLGIFKKVSENEIELERRITFDRVNLQIVEQREYDPEGSISSYTRYGNWQIYGNIRFPSRIEMTRPKDEYGVVISISKMELNKPVPDARFVLAKPEGTVLQTIGANK